MMGMVVEPSYTEALEYMGEARDQRDQWKDLAVRLGRELGLICNDHKYYLKSAYFGDTQVDCIFCQKRWGEHDPGQLLSYKEQEHFEDCALIKFKELLEELKKKEEEK